MTYPHTAIRLAMFTGMFFFMVVSSCKKSEDPDAPKPEDPCGEKEDWYSNLRAVDNTISEELNGNTRTLIIEDVAAEPDDICAQEHCQAMFEAGAKDGNPVEGVSFTAKTYWFVGRNKVTEMEHSVGGYYYVGQEIGMLDAFGKDKPGYAGLQIIAKFPSQGSLEADKAWLDSKFSTLKVRLKYKKFKTK